jgi:glycine betaine/proline transport system substrate-binding protein
VSKNFHDSDPVLSAFLARFNVPLDLLNGALAEMSEQKLPARQAAQTFLKQHPELLKKWLDAEVAAKVTASLK